VDVTTMQQMVEETEARFGKAKRIWVMDRGMTSEANLEWLRRSGRKYVVGTPRSELRKWECKLSERVGWQTVRDGLVVKLCEAEDGKETFLLCRSDDRRIKEEAMHSRFRMRLLKKLGSLGRRLKNATMPVKRSQIDRQIGRMLEANSRASKIYEIDVVSCPQRASGVRLTIKLNRAFAQWAALSEGTYILRSNVNEWTAEELWRTYVQLCEAEAAFRIQKSDLQLRPIWHQRADRVRGHIFICFIAYALWKTLQGWQQGAQLGSSPRTLMAELAKIRAADVVLPLVDGGEARIRCVVRPDASQAALLDRMGLTLPSRLRGRLPGAEM
jgi:transposase